MTKMLYDRTCVYVFVCLLLQKNYVRSLISTNTTHHVLYLSCVCYLCCKDDWRVTVFCSGLHCAN
jgi:hypothetical protein